MSSTLWIVIAIVVGGLLVFVVAFGRRASPDLVASGVEPAVSPGGSGGAGSAEYTGTGLEYTDTDVEHELAVGEPVPADPPFCVDVAIPPEDRPSGSIPDPRVFSTAAPSPTSEHEEWGPATTRADDIIEETLVSHPESDQTDPISERDTAGPPQAESSPDEPTSPVTRSEDPAPESPAPEDPAPRSPVLDRPTFDSPVPEGPVQDSPVPDSPAPASERDTTAEHVIGSEDTGSLDSGAGFDELPSIDSFDPDATPNDGDPSPSRP